MRRALDATLFELRYSLRSVRNAPAFATLVVLTLAVGVGTNGAVYSALDQFILGVPLGVRDASLVKRVHQQFTNPYSREVERRDRFSVPEYEAMAHASRETRAAAYLSTQTFLGDSGNAREVRADFVLGEFFTVLGTRAAAGRLFHAREIDSSVTVAVISHDLWTNRFGSAPEIIGRTISIGGFQFHVVGVAEEGFRGIALNATHVWLPYGTPGTPFFRPGQRPSTQSSVATVVARVRNTAELTHAPTVLGRALKQYDVVRDTAAVVRLAPISQRMSTRSSAEWSALKGVAGATGAILLIACLNTAILILVRAAHRRRETAIRFALGISRSRLLLQIGAETLLYTVVVIATGLLASGWSGGLLRNGLIPNTQWGSSLINGRVVLMIVVFGILAAIASAAVPAFFAINTQIADGVRGARGSRSPFARRLRGGLLALQAAVAVVLLAGAAVFVQSLRNILSIPTGYRPDDVILVQAPPDPSQPREHGQANFTRIVDLHEQMRQLPGVEVAALTAIAPAHGMTFAPIFNARGDTLGMRRYPLTTVSPVSPGYLAATGTRILRGRDFSDEDHAGSARVVIVSESAARMFWPRQDAIGQCVILYKLDSPCRPVIGISEDVRVKTMDSVMAGVYVPLTHASGVWTTPRALVLRTTPGKSAQVLVVLRQSIAGFGSEGSNWWISKLHDALTSQLRPHRLSAFVFTGLAVLALIIASIGIYGTTSYTVTDLTQEIGVRRALGGDGVHVSVLLLQRTLLPVALGTAMGMVLSLALGNVSTKLIYQTSPGSPGIIATVAVILIAVTAVACVAPFVRALRVSPMTALTAE